MADKKPTVKVQAVTRCAFYNDENTLVVLEPGQVAELAQEVVDSLAEAVKPAKK